MEDLDVTHARACESPWITGKIDPEVPPGRKRILTPGKYTNMNLRSKILNVMVAGCMAGSVTAPSAMAVTDEEFNALKDLVVKQGELISKQGQKIDQLQQTHEQDQTKIDRLKEQVGDTRTVADNAAAKADAAATTQAGETSKASGMPATHEFMVVGDAEVGFSKVSGQHKTFTLADFAPIFLFRATDDILFEAGFDVMLQNNAPTSSGATTTIDLSFAQLDYIYNDYLTFVAGDMLLPLGVYSERSAGWLNKIVDDPLPRGFLPGTGVGAQARGSIAVGESGQMVTYSLYGVNGPSSWDNTGTAGSLDLSGNVGQLSSGDIGNLHGGGNGGGRIGWFYPFKAHYDFELGASGQSGTWFSNGGQSWSAAVADATVHISPYFEAKGEYINTWVGSTDVGIFYPRGWWVQAAYKLAGLNLDLPLISNFELVARYDTANDGLGAHMDRITAGCVYYLTNTLQLKGDYEFTHGPNMHDALLMQISYGF